MNHRETIAYANALAFRDEAFEYDDLYRDLLKAARYCPLKLTGKEFLRKAYNARKNAQFFHRKANSEIAMAYTIATFGIK